MYMYICTWYIVHTLYLYEHMHIEEFCMYMYMYISTALCKCVQHMYV